MATTNHRQQAWTYVLSDYLALNLGWLLFTLVRYSLLPSEFTEHYSFWSHLTSMPVAGGQFLFPLMMVSIYWLSGYYNTPFFKSRLDDVVNTAWVSAVGGIIIFFAVLVNDGIPERLANLEILGLLWLFLAVPVFLSRAWITRSVAKKIRNRELYFNTLIIGTGRSAVELAERLEKASRGNGFKIVGLVETNPESLLTHDLPYPVSDLADLEDTIARADVRRLIIVPHRSGLKRTTELIGRLLPLNCRIFVTPDLYSLLIMRPRLEDVVGEPLVDISSPAFSPMTANFKRTADVFISAMAMVVLCPVYLALAIAIKLDSKGPVLYRQERIGYRKKPFNILKFRSMKTDAESGGPALSSLDDPRITRLGHYLRKYRLDELPQFYNVFVGDMSLVGPRPERLYYITQIVARVPYYTLVHRVRPGITSWGMVKYGYATTVDQMIERLRYDLIYLDNVSLPVDIKILFHTVRTVFTGQGL